MADFDRMIDAHRLSAPTTGIAGPNSAQVHPFVDHNISVDVDVTQMEVIFIGAGRQASPTRKSGIGDDPESGNSYGSERSRCGSQCLDDGSSIGRLHRRRTRVVTKLLLHELVVTAHQYERQDIIDLVDERLDLAIGGGRRVEFGKGLDGPDPRSCELFESGRCRVVDWGRHARRSLQVGCVAARASDNLVFARLREHHELNGVRASHGSRRGFHHHRVHAAPAENLEVGIPMPFELDVEAGIVDIERVRILHRELAYAQDP